MLQSRENLNSSDSNLNTIHLTSSSSNKSKKHKRRPSRRRSNTPSCNSSNTCESENARSRSKLWSRGSSTSLFTSSHDNPTRRPSVPALHSSSSSNNVRCHRPPLPPENGHDNRRFGSRSSNVNLEDEGMLRWCEKREQSSQKLKMSRSESEGGNLEKVSGSNHVIQSAKDSALGEKKADENNKDGRIQYSREFLLNLQFEPDSLKIPKDPITFPEIIHSGMKPGKHPNNSQMSDSQHRAINSRQVVLGDSNNNFTNPLLVQPIFNNGLNNVGMGSKSSSMSLPSMNQQNSFVSPRFPHPNHPAMMMMMAGHQQQQLNQLQQQRQFLQQQQLQQQNALNNGRQLKGKPLLGQQQVLQQPQQQQQQQSLQQSSQQPLQQQQQQPQRRVIQMSLGQNVQLHQSENAWKPMMLANRKDDLGLSENCSSDLYRKVRSILNKLTPQKFDTLIQQVHDLSIDTEEKLKGCIKLIFEKAIGEPSYSIAYAQMAKSLNNLRVHMDEQPSETVTFRKLLLNQCQKEFEKDKLEEIDLEKMTLQIEQSTSEKEKLQLTEAKQQAENVAKRRSIGNIRFIGELYKLKMLTDNIMFECINRLLKYSNDEDNVECLCRLLITIGFDLDNANPLSKQRLNQTFEELKSISYSKSISSRIKFMIQDVLELRENDWVPRREDTQPKLIEQIHKEAELEEMQRKQHLHHPNAPSLQQLHHHPHHHHHQQQQQHPFYHPQQPHSSKHSLPHEIQRSLSSSTASEHGMLQQQIFNNTSGNNQQPQQQYHGRGSIDRSIKSNPDKFGSLERMKIFENSSLMCNSSSNSRTNAYATLGPVRRGSARALVGCGASEGKSMDGMKSYLMSRSMCENGSSDLHDGSSTNNKSLVNNNSNLPPSSNAFRSRSSASDIYATSANTRNQQQLKHPTSSSYAITPRSRVVDPKSFEKDKHSAIEAARNISSSHSMDSFMNASIASAPNTFTNSSFNGGKPFSRSSLSSASSSALRQNTKPPHLTSVRSVSLSPRELANKQMETEKKCKSLLDEYLANDDLQEACFCFKDINSHCRSDKSQSVKLVSSMVERSLEKSERERSKIHILLSHLILKNLISLDVFLESLSSVLKEANDISVDIPKVWNYLAELISKALLSRVVTFASLSSLFQQVGDRDKQVLLVGLLVSNIADHLLVDLNLVDQPHLMADLIIFLSNLNTNGKGDNKAVNEEMLLMHSSHLKSCFHDNPDLEWLVLVNLKREIFTIVDMPQASTTFNCILNILQSKEVMSKATVDKWGGVKC